LSILKADEEMSLETTRSEMATGMAAAFFKTLISSAPLVGPYIAEAMGVVIPNQKLERLIIFARVLDDKLKYLKEDTVKLKMETEEFRDLLEDAFIQAGRAMTDARREYIAALLKNSIRNETLDHIGEKKLLALLNELNDAEILTLKFYSLIADERRKFAEVHSDLFAPIDLSHGAPEENIDKGALRSSYRNKLIEIKLLEPVYKRSEKGKVPEFDEKTGQMKATSLKVTWLGKLLLRYIDQSPSTDDAVPDIK
jgi:hypothetical protein